MVVSAGRFCIKCSTKSLNFERKHCSYVKNRIYWSRGRRISLNVPIFSIGDELLISTMFVCGDSYLMLAKCQENLAAVHQEDYRFKSDQDVFISEAAEDFISSEEGHSSSVKFVCDLEQNMLKR